MVKCIKKYLCETCQNEFNSHHEAEECEQKGKENQRAKVGDKIIFTDKWNGGFGEDKIEYIVGEVTDWGHEFHYMLGVTGFDNVFHPHEIIYGERHFEEICELK